MNTSVFRGSVSARALPDNIIHGVGVSGGSASGRIEFVKREDVTGGDPAVFRGIREETEDFYSALSDAGDELNEVSRKTAELAGGDAAAIFEIHGMLLTDPDFSGGVEALIKNGVPAVTAVGRVTEEMASVFDAMEDEYFRGRAADVRDVGGRVVRLLSGKERGKSSGKSALGGRSEDRIILVSPDLTPGETAGLDTSRVAGIVTFGGSASSHSAILAKALGIPAIIGTGGISPDADGKYAVIDGDAGTLTVEPEAEQLSDFYEKQKRDEARRRELERIRELPAVTKSGKRIAVFANVGSAEEAEAAFAAGAEGIGLFRSEFLFLGRNSAPTEEEQYSAYRRAIDAMRGRDGVVVVRTLDVGADKVVPYLDMPESENPALSVRGIRLCLRNPDLFRTQLRALCRASAHGRLAVMLPMVVSADEIGQTRMMLREEAENLRREGQEVSDDIPVGIMIETPASAVMAKELAKEADFFSVGTNDLCQYTFAADRQDPELSYLTEGEGRLEPVFRLIRFAAACIHAENAAGESSSGMPGKKWIGICGELAADPSLTARFIDCGADELSVSPPYLLSLRESIRLTE